MSTRGCTPTRAHVGVQRPVKPETGFVLVHDYAAAGGRFFYARELLAQPQGLGLGIGAGQAPPRALHGEAEGMQQPRHVVVVVPDAEALRNQVPDHRAGPDAAGISRVGRPRLDQGGQLVALGHTELRRGARRDPGEQPLHAERVVPLQPSIDRPPGDIEFRGEVHDPAPLDVSEHAAGATPDVEVVVAPGLVEKSP